MSRSEMEVARGRGGGNSFGDERGEGCSRRGCPLEKRLLEIGGLKKLKPSLRAVTSAGEVAKCDGSTKV
jgi:hypothetical protein